MRLRIPSSEYIEDSVTTLTIYILCCWWARPGGASAQGATLRNSNDTQAVRLRGLGSSGSIVLCATVHLRPVDRGRRNFKGRCAHLPLCTLSDSMLLVQIAWHCHHIFQGQARGRSTAGSYGVLLCWQKLERWRSTPTDSKFQQRPKSFSRVNFNATTVNLHVNIKLFF